MRILVIDNYDSFTYNLVHDLQRAHSNLSITVIRNDVSNSISFSEYDGVVISPGPGLPVESGRTLEWLHSLKDSTIPVLGVCLGLQSMVEITGGSLYNQPSVKHGVPGVISHDGKGIYAGLESPLEVGLYHSWAARKLDLPSEWIITATSNEDVIMSIEHRSKPWIAVQFHPESVLSPSGRTMLANWIKVVLDDDSART